MESDAKKQITEMEVIIDIGAKNILIKDCGLEQGDTDNDGAHTTPKNLFSDLFNEGHDEAKKAKHDKATNKEKCATVKTDNFDHHQLTRHNNNNNDNIDNKNKNPKKKQKIRVTATTTIIIMKKSDRATRKPSKASRLNGKILTRCHRICRITSSSIGTPVAEIFLDYS